MRMPRRGISMSACQVQPMRRGQTAPWQRQCEGLVLAAVSCRYLWWCNSPSAGSAHGRHSWRHDGSQYQGKGLYKQVVVVTLCGRWCTYGGVCHRDTLWREGGTARPGRQKRRRFIRHLCLTKRPCAGGVCCSASARTVILLFR